MADTANKRGELKIFLSYAPGVGKSYVMLEESHRRKKRGADVVIGVVHAMNRSATMEVAEGLEAIPERKYVFQGTDCHEMDLDAILARKPEIVLIDDLHHTNAPGSQNEKRWMDVERVLEAGISVLSTMNILYLESLNDQIAEITGIRFKDTVPDRILHEATEIEYVDLTPRALIHRSDRGELFPDQDAMDPAMASLFFEDTLNALRELAMREAAGVVDEDLEAHREQARARPYAARDRVMICVTPNQPSMRLIRRGWRMAHRMRADVVAVFVTQGVMNEQERKNLEDDLKLAARLSISTIDLHGHVAPELIRYARENAITHMVLGHSEHSRVQEILRGSIISTLARELKNIDILLVASEVD